ncbi:hypothetical protein [Phycicoccus flavus]|uniref:hypothetical protein n=1 Tax=Phycicoccus flavus TaxID=2502783 RepID=UPI000FEB7023|nr:hypothetical protein [Phycicoccus flavus]NHA67633.1 hypothetical protein [Phycicoccus flavus]
MARMTVGSARAALRRSSIDSRLDALESDGRAALEAEAEDEAKRGRGQPDRPTDVAVAKAKLEAVRTRADGWRNGVAGTFTLVLASLAIKPGEGFMKYQGVPRYVLMVLLTASLGAALVSLFRMVRAANGPTWLSELDADASARRWDIRTAAARHDLQRGRLLWMVSLALFCLAVGVSWVVTPAPPPTP